ncbi:hypothetical protein MVES1_000367 [Malassezia vespertilionis]|uniref:uncharacterized protein n=1 Tax=Malassezia vespertilionis TaxID=2020962 RepID=UPI0024B2072B|nr:uncharacterized protein MVES1_000367 [Malassezia vespertilionis]WFD05042.1 hypothetical protein MVES1_000367 [Malassezia vespertilionis]
MPSNRRGDKMRNAATQEALRSSMRYRHGAVITKGGKILGQGYNHVRTGFSGPLAAHNSVELPAKDAAPPCEDCQGCMNDEHADALANFAPRQTYFSMHAEMHCITSALRGARPNLSRSSVMLGPSATAPEDLDADDLASKLGALAFSNANANAPKMPAGSRSSDAPTSARMSAADLKTKCSRALVEGAKREQQRIALATQDKWRHGRGRWVGNYEEQRLRSEYHAFRARRLEQRKQEKRDRKARGARAMSSGGSASSDTTQESQSSISEPGTPSPVDRTSASDNTKDQKCNYLAYRRISSAHTRAREEQLCDSRLRGADLYVVRLLQDAESKAKAKEQRRRYQYRTAGPGLMHAVQNVAPRYADSRPCWRCLEWMWWAGIKRVYWTSVEGVWHGGKVAELLFGTPTIDALHSGASLVPVHLTQYEHAAALRHRQRRDA